MDAGDLFRDLVWHAIVKAALGRLFLLVPLLGWGPIGYIITYFAMKYADQLYEGVRLLIEVEVIVFRNKEFEKAYDDASVKLHIIAKDKGIDSPEFRSAREENRKRLSDLARFNVAR